LGKILLLIAGVFLLFWVFGVFAKNVKQKDKAQTEIGESMVRCMHCGVHLPASEAIASREEYFCSEEHRCLRQQ